MTQKKKKIPSVDRLSTHSTKTNFTNWLPLMLSYTITTNHTLILQEKKEVKKKSTRKEFNIEKAKHSIQDTFCLNQKIGIQLACGRAASTTSCLQECVGYT